MSSDIGNVTQAIVVAVLTPLAVIFSLAFIVVPALTWIGVL
jgi:hypothetical protein